MANKYLDSNGVLYLWQKIKAAFASAADMTQAKSDIQALQNVGAQANVIETVKRNGTALTVTNKAVDVTVPTKTSDLTNNSNFVADADYVHTDSNFTADEKTKLAGIATGANKTTVATSITSSGTNPVTSKAIYDALADKADKATSLSGYGITNAYTKTEVDSALGNKAPLASPAFTGTPTAPTAAQTVNNTQIATTAYVRTAVDGKADAATTLSGYGITDAYTKTEVDSALDDKQDALTFDTTPTSGSTNPVTSGGVYAKVNALAPKSSPTFTGTPKAPTAAQTVNNTQIATTAYVRTAVDGKADEATTLAGYGITDAYTKSEVDAAIAAGTALDIDSAPTSGSDHLVTSGGVYTALSGKAPLASPEFTGTPTAPTPATTDNSTKIATTAFVANMMAQVHTFAVTVVQTLPATGVANTLYFVPNSGPTGNVYDEYMYISDGTTDKWELLGTTEVDLSDYMKKSDMVAITNAEIDTIVAS